MKKKHVEELIAQNRLIDATQSLKTQLKTSKDKNQLALLESRLTDVNEQMRLGTLSQENSTIELNQIRNGLLGLNNKVESVSEKTISTKYNPRLLIPIIIALLLCTYFLMKNSSVADVDCMDSKVAILVADFQNKEQIDATDAFANSLVTNLDALLDDSYYDVSPVGTQSRQMKRYDQFITDEYFTSSCDTSGLFVNGFLGMKEKVFNIYMTTVGLRMQGPKIAQEKSLELVNPKGIEFSISSDSKFLADLIYSLLKAYEGDSKIALEKILEVEKNDKQGITRKDKNVKATIAYLKGNCYAMRGDDQRAKKQYQLVNRIGNPELKKAANENISIADKINARMKKDPELNKELQKNKRQHSNFESELEKILKSVGKKLDKIFKIK